MGLSEILCNMSGTIGDSLCFFTLQKWPLNFNFNHLILRSYIVICWIYYLTNFLSMLYIPGKKWLSLWNRGCKEIKVVNFLTTDNILPNKINCFFDKRFGPLAFTCLNLLLTLTIFHTRVSIVITGWGSCATRKPVLFAKPHNHLLTQI